MIPDKNIYRIVSYIGGHEVCKLSGQVLNEVRRLREVMDKKGFEHADSLSCYLVLCIARGSKSLIEDLEKANG